MAENADHRKLAAILCADVKGYSKLMGEDESYTVGALKERRKLFAENIQNHGGRVVNAPGDSILAEFPSVVSAVQCAVEIQTHIDDRNAELPDNRKMVFRIGVNLGDVIESEDAIYGDGVNIAARIEVLADPGGVSISRTVFNQVRNKLPYGYEYQGEHQVKNITNPVKVYKLLTAPDDAGKLIGMEPPVSASKWIWPTVVVAAIVVTLIGYQVYQEIAGPKFEPASVEKMAYDLPDKPSIAVLPFDNMSEESQQEYFCDGLTEEIITALSKVPKVFVIARNSVFTYKGKPIKVSQVAEELGIRYVLEGSVRKGGEKIRITAQLIDAVSGHHLWAERYDRDLKDIFSVQDELTKKIITAMQVELTSGEQALVDARGTENLQAYLKFLQAREAVNKLNIEGNALGRQLAQEAIGLDPQYAMPYRILAATYRMDVILGISKSPKESYTNCIELLNKAIELDDTYAEAYGALGFTFSLMGQHEKALSTAEKAVALDPNSATTYAMLGHTFRMADRPREAIQAYTKAIRLNPIPPTFYQFGLGMSYGLDGQYEKGIKWCQKAVKQNPDDFFARLMLTAVYSMAGQDDKAHAEAMEVLRINPKYSLAKAEKRAKIKYKDKWFAALRKAGLPENPPRPIPDRPSIAVLPFDNLSGDPEQEYFSDGITEDIITALSKTPKMLVIARNSTFTYKGKPVKVQQVANELSVRYVLEGSVQKAGERVRITAQLVDAKSGHHLWAEKYDRDLKDIFALQDEITKEIIISLQVNLTEGEQARIRAKGANNLDAYLKSLEAKELVTRWNIEDNHKARQLYTEALELDPNYSISYCGLAITHIMDVWLGSTKSKKDSLFKATELVQKALSLDNYSGYAHRQLGSIYYQKKQYEKGILEFEKAVELEPNYADGFASLARSLDLVGRTEEAIQMSNKAMRLNPIPPDMYIIHRTAMYRNNQNYEEALIWAKKAVERAPNNFFARMNLCSVYSLLGQMEEARLEAAEIKKLNPKFSLAKYSKTIPYKVPAVKKQYIDALRNAGVPD
jgi:adenylate cyclase